MMRILYIAYSCDPYSGSEDKIGWNIPFESAKTNEVYLITKEEHRDNIKRYISENNRSNLYIYFVDIPGLYKKFFDGFFYSGRLNVWNRRVFPLAKEICEKKNIEIIHQITPIEFRSIGNYGQIKNTKFICGPLGGGEQIPHALKSYMKKHWAVEIIRKSINQYSKMKLKLLGKLKKCDYILFANSETRDFLIKEKELSDEKQIITEIAISEKNISYKKRKKDDYEVIHFLVAGRLIYRKGYDFLLDAMERIPDQYSYQCRIVGSGPEYESIEKRCLHNKQLQGRVILAGRIPYDQMEKEYNWADVLIMPSLRETTGSVILEAMAQGIPVITIGKFGGSKLVDDCVGWTYTGNTKDNYIENLKNIMIRCIDTPSVVYEKGRKSYERAKQYTWKEKCRQYQLIYMNLLKK